MIRVALMFISSLVLFISSAEYEAFRHQNVSDQYLTVSAVVSNPASGEAEIQCWQFKEPLHEYPTVGKALHLGDMANMTYVVLPPQSNEGLHHPPHNMFFVLLSGVAHVTLPSRSGELWIVAGVNPLIVATDINGLGHYTAYPADTESMALQIPFAEGRVPEHVVLFNEACPTDEETLRQSLRKLGI